MRKSSIRPAKRLSAKNVTEENCKLKTCNLNLLDCKIVLHYYVQHILSTLVMIYNLRFRFAICLLRGDQ